MNVFHMHVLSSFKFLILTSTVAMGDLKSMSTLAILLFCYPVNYLNHWISPAQKNHIYYVFAVSQQRNQIYHFLYVFLNFFLQGVLPYSTVTLPFTSSGLLCYKMLKLIMKSKKVHVVSIYASCISVLEEKH